MITTAQLGMTQWNLPGERLAAIRTAARLGLHCVHVELGSREKGTWLGDPALQRRLLDDARAFQIALPALAVNNLCETGFIHPKGTGQRARAEAFLREGITAAAAMRIPAISIPSFGDNEIRSEDDFTQTAEALRDACDFALPLGVAVCTENVLGPEDMTRLFQAVDRENLQLMFDTQNYACLGHPWAIDVYRSCRKRVSDYLHLKDGVNGMGNRALGQGTCAFAETWRVIREDAYPGWIILENDYPTMDALKQEIDAFEANWLA